MDCLGYDELATQLCSPYPCWAWQVLVALPVFASVSQVVAVGNRGIALYAPSIHCLTWRSVVLVSQSDFDYPRATRYACQAQERTVLFGGLWGTWAALSREMVLGAFLSSYPTSGNTSAGKLVDVMGMAIAWIHVLVREPNPTNHEVLEIFGRSNMARSDAIRQCTMWLMLRTVPYCAGSLQYRGQRGRQANCRCFSKHEAYCMSVISAAQEWTSICMYAIFSTPSPDSPKEEKDNRRYLPRAERHKKTIGVQPLPRHRELQAKLQTGNSSYSAHTPYVLSWIPPRGDPARLTCRVAVSSRNAALSDTGILDWKV